MISEVRKCFNNVVEDGIFVVGIDRTGVYLFTETANYALFQREKEKLCNALALEDGQVVACSVGFSMPGAVECAKGRISFRIHEMLGRRKEALGREKVQEICSYYGADAFWGEEGLQEALGEESWQGASGEANGSNTMRHIFSRTQVFSLLSWVVGVLAIALKVGWWVPIFPFVLSWMLAARVRYVYGSWCSLLLQVMAAFGLAVVVLSVTLGNGDSLLQLLQSVVKK